ncbi:MAG: type 1 glutamine amidotransferase [Syntrophobacter sp.]
MRLHYLQHVEFEGPANIGSWAKENGHEISSTHLYRWEKLPSLDSFDWLVVLGGPMNIYEDREYPWLNAEKKFIREAVASNKIVLGICLGAQLLSDVLGGQVVSNPYKEIGWYPVRLLPGASGSGPFRGFPKEFMALHWHGDTFSLPKGAIMLAESEACPAQAFSYNGGRVVALQFHIEFSHEIVLSLVQNCADEMVDGQYIQRPDAILARKEYFEDIHGKMLLLLRNIKSIEESGVSVAAS